jgi:hypothetical protein
MNHHDLRDSSGAWRESEREWIDPVQQPRAFSRLSNPIGLRLGRIGYLVRQLSPARGPSGRKTIEDVAARICDKEDSTTPHGFSTKSRKKL